MNLSLFIRDTFVAASNIYWWSDDTQYAEFKILGTVKKGTFLFTIDTKYDIQLRHIIYIKPLECMNNITNQIISYTSSTRNALGGNFINRTQKPKFW